MSNRTGLRLPRSSPSALRSPLMRCPLGGGRSDAWSLEAHGGPGDANSLFRRCSDREQAGSNSSARCCQVRSCVEVLALRSCSNRLWTRRVGVSLVLRRLDDLEALQVGDSKAVTGGHLDICCRSGSGIWLSVEVSA